MPRWSGGILAGAKHPAPDTSGRMDAHGRRVDDQADGVACGVVPWGPLRRHRGAACAGAARGLGPRLAADRASPPSATRPVRGPGASATAVGAVVRTPRPLPRVLDALPHLPGRRPPDRHAGPSRSSSARRCGGAALRRRLPYPPAHRDAAWAPDDPRAGGAPTD